MGTANIRVCRHGFEGLYVHPNWTALAPEDALIKFHRKLRKRTCPWNGNGHDPGRQRETTNEPTEGFGATYPIRDDWPALGSKRVTIPHTISEISQEGLPYLLRFEGAQPKSQRPRPDYLASKVTSLARKPPRLAGYQVPRPHDCVPGRSEL
jgi:hypothetical protein